MTVTPFGSFRQPSGSNCSRSTPSSGACRGRQIEAIWAGVDALRIAASEP
jgi:hypothetical protein